ncbi:restriction endonuclease [Salmonella enterica subsp. enterica]|nr:restriction endonuclease subunit S [Salmonella enterica]ECG3793627.1 restriction endonuclease subunit S [Salmonella enterica subsp. enterica serovar Menston]ECG3796776.1 restriction endonuclease subunit S [Salmonella enterica subsp. enterica serovar Menston]ECT4041927.1 restriction endonuclease subunit S [Salmonella enterica subsp. enterica serovar Menston]ECT4044765.1 restriction endonuclease subunit S [Salmonella enterica subsp. enterica serovar Menston]
MSFDILDNLSIKLIDGDRGKNYPKQSDFFDKSDCLFLSAKNVTKAGFEFADCSFISKEKDQQLRAGKLERNDIVLTTRGTIGNSALYDSSVSISSVRINSGMIILRPDTNIWNPRFLYFLLNSDFVLQQISALTSGSAVPQLPARDLKKFILPRVSLDKQHKIVEIIGSIVDKIRVSKAINQTLEQMAQALFKSWFVDFEPVKAKIAVLEAGGSQEDATLAAMTAISGKDADALAVFEREHPEQYAELKATAELFPSAMQDSELGKIPEGWSIKPLDGIATYQNGLALQKFRPENENDFLPVVKIAQLKKGFSDGEEKASPNIKPECIIDNGDVVFSWSGSLMVDIWCGGQAALNQHLFKVSSTKYPKWLYYKYTAHHLIEFQRIAEAKAVTMGHIKREHLSQAKCLIPSSETICAFTPFFEPVLNRVISNRLESRKLENLRDTLLPKLLSGEITLPEAEQIISEEA